MSSVQSLREKYPILNSYNDRAVLDWYSAKTGVSTRDLGFIYGVTTPTVDLNQGDFMRGLSSGIDSIQGGLYGLTGYLGAVTGADSVRDWGYRGYQSNMDQISDRAKDTDRAESVEGIGDAIDFAQYWLGYAIPQIAEAIIGSKGAGAVAGQAVKYKLKKELVSKFGKDTANAALKSKKIKEAIKNVTDGRTPAVTGVPIKTFPVIKPIMEGAKAVAKGKKTGSLAGLGAQAVGQEMGFTYGGAVDEAIAEGKTIEDVNLGRVTAFGLAAGATEFASDVLTLGLAKFGPAKDLMSTIGKGTSRTINTAAKLTAGAGMEGTTELIQTGLEEMGAGKTFAEANFSDPTSFWAGAIGGGAMGGVGGLITERAVKPSVLEAEAKVKIEEEEIVRLERVEEAKVKIEEEKVKIEEAKVKIEEAKVGAARLEAAKTFTDKDVWIKAYNKKVIEQRNKDIIDPKTKLGAEFERWQLENKRFDTNKQNIKDFILKSKVILPKKEAAEKAEAEYFKALDLHGVKELETNKNQKKFLAQKELVLTEEREQQLNKVIVELLLEYNNAKASKNEEKVRIVDQKASERLSAAEWKNAKKNQKKLLKQNELDSKEEREQQRIALETIKQRIQTNDSNDVNKRLIEEIDQELEKLKNDEVYEPSTQQDLFYTNEIADAVDDAKQQPLPLPLPEVKVKVKVKGKGKVKGKVKVKVEKVVSQNTVAENEVADAVDDILTDKEKENVAAKGKPKEKILLSSNYFFTTAGTPYRNAKALLQALNKQGKRHLYDVIERDGGFVGELKKGVPSKTTLSNIPKNPETKARDEATKALGSGWKQRTKARATATKALGSGWSIQFPHLLELVDNNELPEFYLELTAIENDEVLSTKEIRILRLFKELISTSTRKLYSYDQSRVIVVLKAAVKNNTLSDFTDLSTKHGWNNEAIRKKAGLKSSSSVVEAMTKISEKLTKVYGQGGVAAFLKVSKKKVRILEKAKEIGSVTPSVTVYEYNANSKVIKTVGGGGTNINKWNKEPYVSEEHSAALDTVIKVFGTEWRVDYPKLGSLYTDRSYEAFYKELKKAKKEFRPIGEIKNKRQRAAVFALGEQWDNREWIASRGWSKEITDSYYLLKEEFDKGLYKVFDKRLASLSQFMKLHKVLNAEKPKNPTKAKALDAMFTNLLGQKGFDKIKHRVHYFKNLKELSSWLGEIGNTEDQQRVDAVIKEDRGIIEGGVFNGTEIAFVLDNIALGKEAKIFMHEVGGHIGLGGFLSKDYMKEAAELIQGWAKGEGGSALDQRIAKSVATIMDFAGEGLHEDTVTEEWVAHFISEATLAGETPQSQSETGSLLKNIMAMFNDAYSKFLSYIAGTSVNADITTQTFLDMAAGAAYTELIKPNKSLSGAPKFSVLTDRTEARIRKMFPKDKKGKYISEVWIPIAEYPEFQISQSRLEKTERLKVEAQRRDAAQHEKDMEITPKFSIVEKENNKEKKETSDWVANTFGNTMGSAWDTTAIALKNAVDHTKFLHQLVEAYGKVLPIIKTIYLHMLSAEKTRNEILNHVKSIAVRASDLSKIKFIQLNKFIGDSTIQQKWGYNPYEEKDLKHKDIKVDVAFAKRFRKLDKEQQQIIKDVFAHGMLMLKRKREIAKALGLGKNSTAFFSVSGLDGPYAPLMRFGNHIGLLKSPKLLAAETAVSQDDNTKNRKLLEDLRADEQHYVMETFDTPGEAKRFARKHEKKWAFSKALMKTKELTESRSDSFVVLEQVLAGLGSITMDSKAKAKVKKMVTDLYLSSLDETNARKSQAKRKGLAGFNANMIRSFLAQANAEAGLIAQMEHGKEINEAFLEAKEDSRGDLKLTRMYNMIVSHYRYSLDTRNTPIIDRIAALNTVYMLTSSIGYHVQNATQPMMVTIPRLAGDFNSYSGAWSALIKGYGIARDIVDVDVKKWHVSINIEKAPKKYQALLHNLDLRQLLDVGIEQDLSDFKSFDTDIELINKGGELASKASHKLYQLARAVEAYNRVSTAIAAYDMASANPNKIKHMDMSTEEYATNIVENTQGNFAAIDAPIVLKYLPKLTVQYRKYQVMMGWVYANAAKQVWAGDTKAERAAGARTIGFALGHAGVFSGIAGLPLLGQLAEYFMYFSNDSGEPADFERWLRENLGDDVLADMLTSGVLSAIGIDASTKLSQEHIFKPLPYSDFGFKREEWLSYVAEAGLGPTSAVAGSFFRAGEYAKEGNLYRFIENSVPKGFRSLMEAFRLGTKGFTLRNGDVVADPSDFGYIYLALHALGIPVSTVQKFKWTRGQQFELSKWLSEEQSKIRSTYVDAYKKKDYTTMKEMRVEWNKLQDAKDRVRPFYNDDREAIRRTPIKSLLNAPKDQEKRKSKYARWLKQ